MTERLRDMFTHASLMQVALAIQHEYPSFAVDTFLSDVMDDTWDALPLKKRCRKITLSLGKFLPSVYTQALPILEKAMTGITYAYFFPDFIEVYGTKNWELSLAALERTTSSWSAEFAVRAFILLDEEQMMAKMLSWTKHENEHVRRLASEGCRPCLPWGQALLHFKEDPSPVFRILEQLLNDPSAYVRKSVANNLNDISKTQPQAVLQFAHHWYGQNPQIDWIMKHGCRTLLKKGNVEALALFDFSSTTAIQLNEFILSAPTPQTIMMAFSFMAIQKIHIRVEYDIALIKPNGKQKHKRYKLSECYMNKQETKSYHKTLNLLHLVKENQAFQLLRVTLLINGDMLETKELSLSS